MGTRLYILDPIRLFAALAVVFYHFTAMPHQTWFISEFTQFGYLGVPLFFVISGFVISMSAYKRSASKFAISRLLRLYPTYWTGIVYTLIVVVALTDQRHGLRQILTNATMLNVYFGEKNIDGVFWTLLQELKFYCCVFGLIVLGLFAKFRYWVSAWLAITYAYAIFQQPMFMGWFISPDYSAYFIAGVALYLIHSRIDVKFGNIVLLLVSPLAVERAYSLAPVFINAPSGRDQIGAAIIVAAMLGFLYGVARGWFHVGKSKAYFIAGGLTYPLYLIHNAAGKAIMQSLDLPEPVMISIAFAVTLLASYLIYRTVDVGLVPRIRARIYSRLK